MCVCVCVRERGGSVLFCLVGFYGTSIFVGFLILSPIYPYIANSYDL